MARPAFVKIRLLVPYSLVLVEILVNESKETTQFEVDVCPLLVRGPVEHVRLVISSSTSLYVEYVVRTLSQH